MKRLITLVLALVLVLGLSATARADVLWIPDNAFLNQHMDECPRTERNYRSLTEVTVYESPEDGTVMWTIPEGESWHVYYTYEDANGNLWGCVENPENGNAGWIALAYTELVYDYISFAEEFGDEFITLDKVGQLPEEFRDDVVMFWSYPGSEIAYEFNLGQWASEYYPEYDTVYEDALGRRWGYVGYYMGHRNFWICLDDPTADYDTLYPAGTTPEVSVTQPDETEPTLPAEEIKPAKAPFPMGLTVAIIGCVCITVVLLTRKKKSR